MTYSCPECDFMADKKSQLLQHQRTENHWKKFNCDLCAKWFSRKDNLDQHILRHEGFTSIHCDECGQVFSRPYTLQRHKERVHHVGGGRKRPAVETRDDSLTKRLKTDDDPRQFFTLTKIKEQRIQKFRTTTSTYKVSFKDLDVTEDVMATLKKLFTALFGELTKDAKSKDLVRLTVETPSLDYPIVIPFLPVTHLTADRFMAEIERVVQSNEDFAIDESLVIEVTLVNMPDGGVGKRCRFINTEKFLDSKKCIIKIENDDNLCCSKAIVTAKARLDSHPKWNSIRQGRHVQTELAKQLHELADVPLGKCGMPEIKKFQEVLLDYQIHVISKEHFNAIIYSGPEATKKYTCTIIMTTTTSLQVCRPSCQEVIIARHAIKDIAMKKITNATTFVIPVEKYMHPQ